MLAAMRRTVRLLIMGLVRQNLSSRIIAKGRLQDVQRLD
jgi:hypothetical protein